MKEVTVKVGAINRYVKAVSVPMSFKQRFMLLFQGWINIEVETYDSFQKDQA